MNILHKKSKCCNAKIVRFGAKRRQCTACKRTWRIYPAKRGPKPSRKQNNYLKKVFNHGFRIKQLFFSSRLSADTIYKRFAKNLNEATSKKRIIRVRGSKLILIIDAQWHYFKKELWTIYCLSIKSVDSETVTMLDPILKKGKESAASWNAMFDQLPVSLKNRVVVVVSDGIRGIEGVVENNGWIIQRCHFHLLSMLQKMRGKRSSTSGRLIREKMYQLVKATLSESSKYKLNNFCKRIEILSKEKDCPVRMRMVARDFLRKISEFRNYLTYPDLNIPTTTNVMESFNSFAREKAKTVNTPQSWHKWMIACARFKSKFTCK